MATLKQMRKWLQGNDVKGLPKRSIAWDRDEPKVEKEVAEKEEPFWRKEEIESYHSLPNAINESFPEDLVFKFVSGRTKKISELIEDDYDYVEELRGNPLLSQDVRKGIQWLITQAIVNRPETSEPEIKYIVHQTTRSKIFDAELLAGVHKGRFVSELVEEKEGYLRELEKRCSSGLRQIIQYWLYKNSMNKVFESEISFRTGVNLEKRYVKRRFCTFAYTLGYVST